MFAKGGMIKLSDKASKILDILNNTKPVRLSKGKITVNQSTYDSLGSDKLRELNGTPLATIIIIDDEEWDSLSPSERTNL